MRNLEINFSNRKYKKEIILSTITSIANTKLNKNQTKNNEFSLTYISIGLFFK